VVVRDDLKQRIRTSGGDMREAASHCGLSYTRLNAMLNGFTNLKPEIERKLVAYINDKRKVSK